MKTSETLADWYDDHGEAVFTYIFMMVRDYQLAEDLTQETFVKAYRHFTQFQYQSSSRTWLFRIAQNTTKDHFRKKNPLTHYFNLPLTEPDSSPLPSQLMEMGEQEEALFYSLKKLKPTYRQVTTLRMLKEFSTKETAEILGWSESKVKSNLARALKELKTELVKGGFDYDAIAR
ncbi:RNA polymerase sigma factor [Planomicrobium sp. CPCC 101110]|uniref:RNA polymerase sigma factor n=1 Tax=Planomicrobium sp. CPCC 101110 TaxID=2599619 RepID=UPI0011B718CE|nr:RNA polymerase sigma factor [Planomicrobium sp. CPCC 101110]TWT27226.1 RNA polymerase sigma factor [Planomicrobium sp. CPCC 101110]